MYFADGGHSAAGSGNGSNPWGGATGLRKVQGQARKIARGSYLSGWQLISLQQPYLTALDQIKRGHQYDMQQRAIEHSLVHTVSDRFFRALCEQFKNKVAELQTRVDRINAMPRPQRKHLDEKTDKQQLIQILQRQLDQINTLLGTP